MNSLERALPVIIIGGGRAGPSTLSKVLASGPTSVSWFRGRLLACSSVSGILLSPSIFGYWSLLYLHPTGFQSRAPGLCSLQRMPTGFQSVVLCWLQLRLSLASASPVVGFSPVWVSTRKVPVPVAGEVFPSSIAFELVGGSALLLDGPMSGGFLRNKKILQDDFSKHNCEC